MATEGMTLDEYDADCVCAVCLDLLHLPTICLPCRHVFCDPCLRLAYGSNPRLSTTIIQTISSIECQKPLTTVPEV